ncbi:MAG: hypothetical protein QOI58_4264, partial [Thermoanaerobaculia bacterium]|nr:hypothetical protein [Thermoanaerobaculia bacterium]
MRATVLIALLACWALPACADDGLEQVVHSFATAMSTHDLHAFDALAAETTANGNWMWVRQTIQGSDCFDLSGGSRVILERIDANRARAVIDIQGTATTGTRAPVPLPTPWTLGLTRDARGWRIAFATLTAREMANSFWNGTHEWWQSRSGEVAIPPSVLAYAFADDATGWSPTYARRDQELDYAEALARDAHDDVGVAFCKLYRSRLAWNQKQYAAAVELGESGLRAAVATGNDDVIAAGHFLLALALWKNGDTPRALHDLDLASDVDPLDNRRIALASMLLTSFIHLYDRDYRQAMIIAQKCRTLSRRYDWPQGEKESDTYLSQIHMWLHDFAAASDYARQSLEIARRNGGETRSDFAAEAAFEELRAGDLDHALEHFAEAVIPPFHQRNIIEIKTWYAEALLRAGRAPEAEEQLHDAVRRARELDEEILAEGALIGLSSVCLARGRPREALQHARETLAVRTGKDITFDHDTAWRARLALGRALSRLGRTSEAIRAFRQAIDVIDDDRGDAPEEVAINHFEDKSTSYEELIGLLVARRQPREALRVAERMRSRSLIDSLSRQVDRTQQLSETERARQRSLEQAVVDLNKSLLATGNGRARGVLARRLDEARKNLDRYSEEIAVAHPAARVQRMTIEPRLPPSLRDTAVVEYVVGERHVIALAVRRTERGLRVRSYAIPIRRKVLRKKVDDFCERLASGNVLYAEDAKRLYKLLLEPVANDLQGVKMLAVVPDMELWRLPFQALQRADGTYVIEHHAVFYAPSLATLAMMVRPNRSPAQRGMTLLALGNPTVSGSAISGLCAADRDGSFGPLPDAEREVRSIAALYGPERARVYTGNAAREAVFKQEASHFDILHLATHALLDDHAPMYSSLLLAVSPQDRGEDGLLETREIMRLHLNADLVILAACNTGRGSIHPGEGVIGVSWAFLMSGCPSTIVTQWDVSSASTASVMVDFHKRLTSGMNKAEALRQAQLAALRDPMRRHPFYWAPFVLIGTP